MDIVSLIRLWSFPASLCEKAEISLGMRLMWINYLSCRVYLVFDVEEEKVSKGLRRAGHLLEKKLELFKAVCRIVLHVHECLIV